MLIDIMQQNSKTEWGVEVSKGGHVVAQHQWGRHHVCVCPPPLVTENGK